jgi:hypothetical protein
MQPSPPTRRPGSKPAIRTLCKRVRVKSFARARAWLEVCVLFSDVYDLPSGPSSPAKTFCRPHGARELRPQIYPRYKSIFRPLPAPPPICNRVPDTKLLTIAGKRKSSGRHGRRDSIRHPGFKPIASGREAFPAGSESLHDTGGDQPGLRCSDPAVRRQPRTVVGYIIGTEQRRAAGRAG